MSETRRRNPLLIALYLNAGLMAALLVAVLARSDRPMLPAAWGQQVPQPIAGGAGLFLMPAQFSNTVFGCYIMDVDQQTLCAYTTSGSPPQLKLIAARDFRFDRRLRNYNTNNPTPDEVRQLLEKEMANNRVLGAAAAEPSGKPAASGAPQPAPSPAPAPATPPQVAAPTAPKP